MPVVPTTDYSKSIAHPAPYTPVTLNEDKMYQFARGGVLQGMNLIPASAGLNVDVYPGSFITPLGITVSLTEIVTVTIPTSAVANVLYLYAITSDEIDDDVTIDIADVDSVPTGAVILAERSVAGNWAQRHAISMGDLMALVRGGLVGSAKGTTTAATSSHELALKRFELDREYPPSGLIFLDGLRVLHLDDVTALGGAFQNPYWVETGRSVITIYNYSAGSPTNFGAALDVEALSHRDVVFQIDYLGNGSETTFLFPTGETIELGGQELLVFVDGLLQAESTYTEAVNSVTLDTVYANGTEISIVRVQPLRFRETFTAIASQTEFELADSSYVTGRRELLVFVDGKKQVFPDDYTETDGQTIEFVAGLSGGETVEIMGIRSALISGIEGISVTSPITGGGIQGTVPIGIDLSKLYPASQPPAIGATGQVGGQTGIFAFWDHSHPHHYPLTSLVGGSAIIPSGNVAGGAPGSTGEAADAGHQHPTEGALVTTPNRTSEIDILSKAYRIPYTDPLPGPASILSGDPIILAGIVTVGEHRARCFPGKWSASAEEYAYGFRTWHHIPLDHVANTDVLLRLRYSVGLDHAILPGAIAIAAQIEANDSQVYSVTASLLAPTSLGPHDLALSGTSFIIIPGTAVSAGAKLRIDLARDRRSGSDTFAGDFNLHSALLQYEG